MPLTLAHISQGGPASGTEGGTPLPGWVKGVAVALVLTLCLGPLVPLIARLDGLEITSADLAALQFTLTQAALSAALTCALAIPLARALSRRQVPGIVTALLGAPFILPAIVAVFGLIALFGRQGLINDALTGVGLPPFDIYGLQGVVLAHVFLNLPLATRLIWLGWLAVPAERFRLAASLNAPVTRVIEPTVLRASLPGAALAVFLICLSSFAVALTLGGGPGATTLELAIYQSLRFDFAPGRAALLALGQLALCLVAALVALRFQTIDGAAGLGRAPARWDRSQWDMPVIGLATLFLSLPLVLVALRGVIALPDLPAATVPALANSLIVALGAVVVSLSLALTLAATRAPVIAHLPLALSGMALGAGILLIAAPLGRAETLALPVTALIGGTMALPFAFRAIGPALDQVRARHDRLAATLGLSRAARWRLIYLPLLRAPLAFAAGLTGAMSVGDLGVITLFAGPDQETLPLLMHRLMGSYRTDAAAAVALVLMATAFGLFALCDRLGRR
jgi:thiamine transport system permease protein